MRVRVRVRFTDVVHACDDIDVCVRMRMRMYMYMCMCQWLGCGVVVSVSRSIWPCAALSGRVRPSMHFSSLLPPSATTPATTNRVRIVRGESHAGVVHGVLSLDSDISAFCARSPSSPNGSGRTLGSSTRLEPLFMPPPPPPAADPIIVIESSFLRMPL